MSSSVDDTSIKITSNAQVAYFSSYKGCGNILIEPKFGIYSNKKPVAKAAFDFLDGKDWWECIEHLDAPLDNPVYGILEVDFDTNEIISNCGYGYPTFLFNQWLQSSVQDTLAKREGYLSARAIKYHFKHKNFKFMNAQDDEVKIQYPDTLEEFSTLLEKILDYNAQPNIAQVIVAFPSNWKFIYKEYTRQSSKK